MAEQEMGFIDWDWGFFVLERKTSRWKAGRGFDFESDSGGGGGDGLRNKERGEVMELLLSIGKIGRAHV